ncbi:MAG: hypothetical protein KJN84_05040 [Bacteroidia bacterium]|nr:hypothetical protein [Bacteroidia bacterium]
MYFRLFSFYQRLGLIGFCIMLIQNILLETNEFNFIETWEEAVKTDQSLVCQTGITRSNIRQCKEISVVLKKPSVLVIGNSRINGFRANMFDTLSFYNLSKFRIGFKPTLDYLKTLKEDELPKYLFLLIEPYQFSYGFENRKYADEQSQYPPETILKSIIPFASALNDKKLSKILTQNKYRGIKSKTKTRGYRTNDGSYHYGNSKNTSIERQIAHLDKLTSNSLKVYGKYLFENFNQSLDHNSFDVYSKLIDYTNEKNIIVIGITLPYCQQIQDELDSDKSKYKMWNEFHSDETNQRLKKINKYYYNFSRFGDFEGYNYEMIDQIHPSEKLVGRIIYTLLNENRDFQDLFPSFDKHYFKARIESSDKPLMDVFSN